MEPVKNKGKIKRFLIVLMTLLLITSSILAIKQSTKQDLTVNANSELLRSMDYEPFRTGDEKVDGTDNVEFSAFFLRDRDGDGYAEPLNGTCKEIGKEDTLYMELNVLTEGYLKDAKIEINGENFYFQTALPKDNELKNNYIGNNVKTIEFEDIQNGTEKILTGMVRSGDYSYASQKRSAIGKNINNYSKNDNSVKLTGTYVAQDGTEIEISKTIPLTVDWYGSVVAQIDGDTYRYNDLSSRIDTENNTFTASFNIKSSEIKNQLNINSYNAYGIIPQLNGYNPISVSMESSTGTFSYDPATREYSITREAIVDLEGKITSSLSSDNSDTITIIYPLEAYTLEDMNQVDIEIPVSIYYTGYNNPNDEFSNPYISNIDYKLIKVSYQLEISYASKVGITVGKYIHYPNTHYMVSKQKPLRLYNGKSSEENDDLYKVVWEMYTGTDGQTSGMVLKETKDNEAQKVDTFIKTNSTEDSMQDITANIGIYFVNAEDVLGSSGSIKVYDEDTGILLHTFTASDWDKYKYNNLYYYDYPVKHIKVVTSATNAGSTLYVYNIKELDDDEIVETYTRTQFDDLEYIKSNLTAYLGGNHIGSISGRALYEEPHSRAEISMDKTVLSTQYTQEGMNIFINTIYYESENDAEWANGEFLVKLPDEIMDTQINTVTVNKNGVNIDSYEYLKNDDGKFIKITTSNPDPTNYKITINVDITPDPRIPTITKEIVLYAKNEECDNYLHQGADIYDLDGDSNAEELMHVSSKSIQLIAPNSLLTNQTMSEFDNSDTIIVSPQIAELKPIYEDEDREKDTVKIGAQIRNNYSSTISEVKILGKIPFENNTFVLSGGNLNSEFSTNMTSQGIIVPQKLQGSVSVYYSANENPNQDVEDATNGWVKASYVTNWANIKTWLVDFEETIIEKGEEFTFYYVVEVPFGVDLNKVAYSHHGIFFCLDTPEGKYRTQTEPNKIGIRIADKFNLVLNKYQLNKTKLVKDAIYMVSKLDENGNVEESKTAITNANGSLEMANLYAERVYEIKEVKSPTDYELNDDVIKIIGHINMQNGVLSIEKLQGTTKDTIQVQKNNGEEYKAITNVEDEALATLKIKKVDKDTREPISNVSFKIYGDGFSTNGKTLRTDVAGELTVAGIKIGEEYTLKEVKAKGYYLPSDSITFTVENNNGSYELEWVDSNNITGNTSVTLEDELPIVNVELKNEKIPTFDLYIHKIEKGSGTATTPGAYNNNEDLGTPVSGAKFKLYKDNKEIGEYTTDTGGHFTIYNLNQYVSGKDLDCTYVLKEVYAPEGYAKTSDIEFKVQKSDVLQLISEQTDNYLQADGEIHLIIEDSPSFKLVKKDGETNTLLPNVKFAIYNVEEGEEPARNSKGEIIGTEEVINGVTYYTVKTNANGEITADLPEGLYKAVEIEASEQYDLSNNTSYFGIGKSKESMIEYTTNNIISAGGNSTTAFKDLILTSDGGWIAVGSFYGSETEIGGELLPYSGSHDALIVKYNSNGDVEWSKSFGGGSEEEIYSICETEDGFAVVGYFSSNSIDIGNLTIDNSGNGDGFVIRFDNSGDPIWGYSIGGTVSDYMNSIASLDDGGFILGGKFASTRLNYRGTSINRISTSSYTDGIIIKIDEDGAYEWHDAIGGNNNNNILKVAGTADGGCIIGGEFSSASITVGGQTINNARTGGNYSDVIVIKYDEDGQILWNNNIGGSGNDYLVSVSENDDEEYFVVTQDTNGSNGQNQSRVLKYNHMGENKWVLTTQLIYSLKPTDDGGFIVGGTYKGNCKIGNYSFTSRSNTTITGYVAKFNSDNQVEKAGSLLGVCNSYVPIMVDITSDGKTIVCGTGQVDQVQKPKYTSGGANGIIIFLDEKMRNNFDIKHAMTFGKYSYDQILDICATSDGGYLAGGYYTLEYGDGTEVEIEGHTITGYGSSDGLIIKYNSNGKVERIINLGSEDVEEVHSVYETPKGDYLIVGTFSNSLVVGDYSLTSEGTKDNFLIRYDSNFNVKWAKSLGTGTHYSELSSSMTADGKLLVTFNDEIYKYNEIGEIEWKRTLSNDGVHKEICSSSDGGYVVSSYTGTIKYNSMGEIEWYNPTGWNTQNNQGKVLSVANTNDGGFVVAGINPRDTLGDYTFYEIYSNESFLIKYSSAGNIEWCKSIFGDLQDDVNRVKATSDGGCIVSGWFSSFALNIGGINIINHDGTADNYRKLDGMMLKYDQNGNPEWGYVLGGNDLDEIIGICQTTSGRYVVGGRTYSRNIDIGDERFTTSGNGSTTDGILVDFSVSKGIQEQEEIIVENYRKEFKITTDVEEYSGIKGGSISGEDYLPYEAVKYGESSTKSIIMTPDTDYEIISITVNGKEHQFQVQDDGSYTMPQFTEMTEDKHIVVKYSLKSNKITINKVDSVTGGPVSNIEFQLDQIEERSEPINSDIIGPLTDNGNSYYPIDSDNEVTSTVLGPLTENGEQYFVEQDGVVVPTNSKTYQVANVPGATQGVQNSTANSYYLVDLTGLTGQYKVVVNARFSSQSSDYGYAIITTSETAPTSVYSSSTGIVMYRSGTYYSADYLSGSLDGGNRYYLHLGYRKNASTDTNEDQVVINSVKVYPLKEEIYNFVDNNGVYESTNQGKDSTTCNSYMKVDLTGYSGKYNIIVNAEVSTTTGDYGYALINKSTDAPAYSSVSDANGKILSITSGKSAADYKREIDGGDVYYLHFGYYKNSSINTEGDDTFRINSVRIELSDSELYHTTVTTNSNGAAITQVPFGKYSITEIGGPDDYWPLEEPQIIEFRSTAGAPHEFTIQNVKKAKVIARHYIKGTDTKLAEDDEYLGKVGETYATSPKLDITGYKIEVVNGEDILPENANGTYTYDDIIVNYYYVPKDIPLTVHHYIEGTENPVPLSNGKEASDITTRGDLGEDYTTSPLTDELNEKYELVEIPDNSEGIFEYPEVVVTYYYRVKTFKITTSVEPQEQENELGQIELVKGGTISGEDENPYEVVEYNDNSVKEIKAIPDTGYEVYSISVNGEPIDFDVEADRSVILNQFIGVKSDKNVVVIFGIIQGKVKVNHYIEGTTERIKDLDGQTVQQEVKRGKIGYGYTTKERDDLLDKYEVVGRPVEESGNYTAEEIELNYYYRIKKYPYIVNYLKLDDDDDDSNNIVLHPQKSDGNNYDYGTVIYTSDEIIDIEGYKVDNSTVDSIMITEDNNVLTIYYTVDPNQTKTIKYTVEYYKDGELQEGDTDVVENHRQVLEDDILDVDKTSINIEDKYPGYTFEKVNPDPIPDTIENGEVIKVYYVKTKYPYRIEYYYDEVIDDTITKHGEAYKEDLIERYEPQLKDGYALDRVEGLPLEISDVDENVIKVYYYTIRKIIVNHIDRDTNEVMKSEENKGKTGDTITTSEEDFSGYICVEKPAVEEYTYREDVQTVNYYYSKVSSGVLEKHIDEQTNEVLYEKLHTGVVGTHYNIPSKEFTQYVLNDNRLPDKAEGDMTDELIEVKYYYNKATKVVVHYIYIEGNNQTEIEKLEIPGFIGKEYEAQKKDYDEYVYYSSSTNTEGTMTEDVIDVYYYYKKEAKVIVHSIYKEGDTETEIEQKEIPGFVGDPYETVKKDYDEYVYYSSSTNTEGIMTEDVIDVYYYYKKEAKVVVHYIYKEKDKETEIEKLEIPGFVGYAYESTKKDFDGYVYDSSSTNTEGTMTEDTINVYYYYKKPAQVVVKYIDIVTGEQIEIPQDIPGNVGDEYTTSGKDIDNYILVEDTLNTKGEMSEELIEVIYYYSPKTKVIVKYIDKDTGKEITTEDIIDGYIGKDYTTGKKDIAGYTYVSSTENTTGKMTETTIEVIYYYNQPSEVSYSTYTINYIDLDTGKPINTPKEVKDQEVGTTIYAKALIIDIDDYTFDSADKDSIIIKEGENVINLYYTKNEEPAEEPVEEPKEEPKTEPKVDPEEEIKTEPKTGVNNNTTKQNPTVNKVVPKNVVPVSNTEKNTIVHIILGIIFIIAGSAIIAFTLVKKKKK